MYNKIYNLLIEELSGASRAYRKKARAYYNLTKKEKLYNELGGKEMADRLDDFEKKVPQKTIRKKYRKTDAYMKVFHERMTRRRK